MPYNKGFFGCLKKSFKKWIIFLRKIFSFEGEYDKRYSFTLRAMFLIVNRKELSELFLKIFPLIIYYSHETKSYRYNNRHVGRSNRRIDVPLYF